MRQTRHAKRGFALRQRHRRAYETGQKLSENSNRNFRIIHDGSTAKMELYNHPLKSVCCCSRDLLTKLPDQDFSPGNPIAFRQAQPRWALER